MATTTIDLGTHRLLRVLYLDAAIDPEPTGLDADTVRSVPWGAPEWAEDGQVRAASCAWVIEAPGETVVVDPAGNLDEILHDPASTEVHQAAYARGLRGGRRADRIGRRGAALPHRVGGPRCRA